MQMFTFVSKILPLRFQIFFIPYKTEYDFDGGPSIASIMLSSLGFNKNNLKFSWGLQLNYIFGSLYSHKTYNTYDIIYDQDGNMNTSNPYTEYSTTINSYDGYGIEMQFSIKNKKTEFITSFNMVDNINIIESFYDDIVPEALELGISPDEEKVYKISSPFEFNIGYSYQFNKGYRFIIEYYNYIEGNPYDEGTVTFKWERSFDVDTQYGASLKYRLEFVDEVVDQLDSRKYINHIKQILKEGTSADKQIEIFKSSGDIKQVVDYLISETARDI